MDLNRATILGRLTRDPELKSLPSGKTVATMGVATGRTWTDAQGQKQSQTEFHNVVLWGRQAEVAHQYLRKGRQVYVEGRLQTRDWVGQDGVKRYRTEIVSESMIMIGSAPAGSVPASAAGSASASSSGPSYEPVNNAPQEVIEEEVKVEDIPF